MKTIVNWDIQLKESNQAALTELLLLLQISKYTAKSLV
jgi:hypothetical protein